MSFGTDRGGSLSSKLAVVLLRLIVVVGSSFSFGTSDRNRSSTFALELMVLSCTVSLLLVTLVVVLTLSSVDIGSKGSLDRSCAIFSSIDMVGGGASVVSVIAVTSCFDNDIVGAENSSGRSLI